MVNKHEGNRSCHWQLLFPSWLVLGAGRMGAATWRSRRAARASTSLSSALVLVVPADPELPILALFAAPGCMVEDRVVAHEKLQSTPRRRVRVVDAVVIMYEGTEPRAFSQVTNDVGPRGTGVVLDDRW